MEIMMMLPVDELALMRSDFESKPFGLMLNEFVALMLRRLPHDAKDDTTLVVALRELFAQVDVNGDETMEWDEFMGFIIDAGMAVKKDKSGRDTYRERQGYDDITTERCSGVNRIRILQELNLTCVCGGLSVQMFNPYSPNGEDGGMTIVYELFVGSPQEKTTLQRSAAAAAGGKSKSEVAEEDEGGSGGGGGDGTASSATNTAAGGGEQLMEVGGVNRRNSNALMEDVGALDVCFMPEHDLLAVACSDMSIAFWRLTSRTTINEETVCPAGRVTAPRPQYNLCWCGESDLLFSTGCSSEILAWRLVSMNDTLGMGPQFTLHARPSLRRHTDVVQDLFLVSDKKVTIMASAGMDRHIHFWDPITTAWRGVRAGHAAGVRSVAYDGDGVLLSAGFDFTILAWDLLNVVSQSVGGKPLFKLEGHRHPLLGVRCIPHSERAVSLDVSGQFRWWDIRRTAALEAHERCMHSFTTAKAAQGWPFAPVAFDLASMPTDLLPGAGGMTRPEERPFATSVNGISIVAAGKKIVIFDAVDTRPPDPPTIAALYNDTSLTIVTTSGANAIVWDALSGGQLREYGNICGGKEITALCFDDRKRKLVVGTGEGNLNVYNFMNGSLMKELVPHDAEVSCVLVANADQCIITGSWDRTLRVYDELEEGPRSLLRCVDDAHDGDVTDIAFSHDLSLVASSSTDGTLKVWDYQFMSLDGGYAPKTRDASRPREYTCLQFVDPYPLLLAADTTGGISFVPVRPWLGDHPRYRPALRLVNWVPADYPGQEGAVHGKLAVAVSCMRVVYSPRGGREIAPGITTGCQLLYTGDEKGRIRCWNISGVLEKMGMNAVPENQMKRSMGGYNPRRRVRRDARLYQGGHASRATTASTQPPEGGQGEQVGSEGDLAETGDEEKESSSELMDALKSEQAAEAGMNCLQDAASEAGKSINSLLMDDASQVSMSVESWCDRQAGSHLAAGPEQAAVLSVKDVEIVAAWIGHDEEVRSLDYIQEPLSLLSASADKSVKLWDPAGQPLGVLTRGSNEDRKRSEHRMQRKRQHQQREAALTVLDKKGKTGRPGAKEAAETDAASRARGRRRWHFPVNLAEREEGELEMARHVIKEVQEEARAHLNEEEEMIILAKARRETALLLHQDDDGSVGGEGQLEALRAPSTAAAGTVPSAPPNTQNTIAEEEENKPTEAQQQPEEEGKENLDEQQGKGPQGTEGTPDEAGEAVAREAPLSLSISVGHGDEDEDECESLPEDASEPALHSSALEERTRVFGQLDGKQTWVKSNFELAQEEARQHEADKKRRLQKRKRHGKSRKDGKRKGGSGTGAAHESLEEIPPLPPPVDSRQARKEKKAAGLEQQEDPDDADNWTISSTNRQRTMYTNLYVEKQRANMKQEAADNVKQLRNVANLVQPSEFLMSRLPGLRKAQKMLERTEYLKQLEREGHLAHGSSPKSTTSQASSRRRRGRSWHSVGSEHSSASKRGRGRTMSGLSISENEESCHAGGSFQMHASASAPQLSPLQRREEIGGGGGGILSDREISFNPERGGAAQALSPLQAPARDAGQSTADDARLEKLRMRRSAHEGKGSGFVQQIQSRRNKNVARKRGASTTNSFGSRSAVDVAELGQHQAEIQRAWRKKVEKFTHVAQVESSKQNNRRRQASGLLAEEPRRAALNRGNRAARGPKRRAGANMLDTIGKKEMSASDKKTAEDELVARLRAKDHFGPYTKKDMCKAAASFKRMDKDGTGRVDIVEFAQDPMNNFDRRDRNVQAMFHSMDADESGDVSMPEMIRALFPLMAATDRRDFFAFLELPSEHKAVEKKEIDLVSPQKRAELKSLFDLYDADCSGGVDLNELIRAFSANKPLYSHGDSMFLAGTEEAVTSAELEKLMAEFDADGNKILDFDEFVKLFHDSY